MNKVNNREDCKHRVSFLPPEGEEVICKAGINVRDFVGGEDMGWVKRAPCTNLGDNCGNCEKYCRYTDEEWKAKQEEREKEIQALLVDMAILDIPALKAKHPNGGGGTTPCPRCGNTVNYAVSSYNGHISLKCETEGCLFMME